jgi:2-polyprenyl-6-methoxyphenol hydroxylase-like FAD-dependent oxidoreductase
VAYWLARAGFDVTVVEKAPHIRGGGYPIDIRGVAIDVVTRMGLLAPLKAAHIHTRRLSAVAPSGKLIAAIPADAGPDSTELELPRGELTALLYEATRDQVEYRFDDSITALEQQPERVLVQFQSGTVAGYDVVVGADGLHSNTRRLAFGPEEQFHRYLGHCFAGYSVPNLFGFDHEAVLANTPGTMAALYAAGSRPELHALLAFRSPLPTRAELADRQFQLDAVDRAFDGAPGRTAWLLDRMKSADDIFFDTLSQIVMPSWSSGRVTLVGDAAAAPSFLSGEGTSLALVGGYVLAAELAGARGDHQRAMLAYQDRLRDYVRRNQSLAFTSRRLMLPATRTELALRNVGLRLFPLLRRLGGFDRSLQKAASAVELPDLDDDPVTSA